jgi:hypothetical protein
MKWIALNVIVASCLSLTFSVACSQTLGDVRNLSRQTHRTIKERKDVYPYPGSHTGTVHIDVKGYFHTYCQGSPNLEGTSYWSDPFSVIYDQNIGPLKLIDATINVPTGFYIEITETSTRSVYDSSNFLAAEETLQGEMYSLVFSPMSGFSLQWLPITLARGEVKYTSFTATYSLKPNQVEGTGEGGSGGI